MNSPWPVKCVVGIPQQPEHQPLAQTKYDKIVMLAYYCKTSNISRTLVGNKIVNNSDVVGASPIGAAPTTSSFSI